MKRESDRLCWGGAAWGAWAGVLALSSALLSAGAGCTIIPPPEEESPTPCEPFCATPTPLPSSPSPGPTPTEAPCTDNCVSPTPPPNLSTCLEKEPNDSPGKSNAVSLDCRVNGVLASESAPDWYSLKIPADFDGLRISLILEDVNGDCFNSVDPYLDVYNSSGNQILYHMEDSYEDYCPRIYIPVAAEDSYLLEVSTLWGTYGNYTLDVLSTGPGSIDGNLELADVGGRSGVRLQAGSGGAAQAQTDPGTVPLVPGEVLVRLSDGATLEAIRAQAERSGLTVRALEPRLSGRYGLFRLALPPGVPGTLSARSNLQSVRATRALAQRMGKLSGVASADVNRILDVHKVPNDSYYSEQWGFMSYPGMDLPPVWDETTGSSSVVVAVLDTGVDDTHSDLAANLVPGFDFITLTDNASDGDGPDNDVWDEIGSGHGTHVSGTIAALSNNSKGVAGAAWKSKLLNLRVCGKFGCTEADISEAIWYAAGYQTAGGPGLATARAEVLNMSLGGHDQCSPIMQDVILAASSRNVTVVASAGNEADDAANFTPASCPQVITVGASDVYGRLASFSNFGSALDIIAPGVDILSTYFALEGGYVYMSGTSMAAPHISGLVALLKSINPTFSFATLQSILWETAAPISCSTAGACDPGVASGPDAMIEAQKRADVLEPVEEAFLAEALEQEGEGRRVSAVVEGASFSIGMVPAGTWKVRAGRDLDGSRSLSDSEITHEADTPVTLSSIGEAITDVALHAIP